MTEEWRLRHQLRTWQREAFAAWQAHGHRGVVKVVTGGGKTILALRCMLEIRRIAPSSRTLILVPTLALLDQWYAVLCDDLNVSPQDIALFGGGEKPSPRVVNIAVINTARGLSRMRVLEQPTFLIVDECHRAGSPENRRALKGEHVATLGLSATPERSGDPWFEEVVAPAIGNIIYEYSYRAARRDSVISPFRLVNVRVPLLEAERSLQSGESGEPPGVGAMMRVPVACRLARKHATSRMIVFHERIESAGQIAQVLSELGLRVAEYHAGVSQDFRRENLRLFRRGVYNCLVTCRALDEGADVPEASVAIVARATRSERQRIQRMGRVLRQSEGKDHAVIYTLYVTDDDEARLGEEARALGDLATVSWQRAELPA